MPVIDELKVRLAAGEVGDKAIAGGFTSIRFLDDQGGQTCQTCGGAQTAAGTLPPFTDAWRISHAVLDHIEGDLASSIGTIPVIAGTEFIFRHRVPPMPLAQIRCWIGASCRWRLGFGHCDRD